MAPDFFTPRIDMQKCSASTTTIEPRGPKLALHGLDDLGGHALLDLEAAREALDQTGHLRQSGDAAVGSRAGTPRGRDP